MDLLLTPHKLSGTVTPPPSKSESHRLLLAAALAEGESRLHGFAPSADLRATLRGIEALGAAWDEPAPGELRIRGSG
ncbi:MAG: 3-phosphoshikimate 1-carboxyvinyltransferase, partial [Oscillospiraceae bacterium]|nr:3-phosphoshikimate 1-carboxyvinyltransferase [Oscillospiraceae bacterium]